MAFFPSVPQEGRDAYGNPVKKLDKHGKQIWSKSVDTDHPKKAAKRAALKKKTKSSGFDHEQHRKHNRNIEEIDKKAGIGRFDPKNFSK